MTQRGLRLFGLLNTHYSKIDINLQKKAKHVYYPKGHKIRENKKNTLKVNKKHPNIWGKNMQIKDLTNSPMLAYCLPSS